MEKRRFSDEDLRELLTYIASKPAILFPNLTEDEKAKLISDVLDQLADSEMVEKSDRIIVDLKFTFNNDARLSSIMRNKL